MAHTPLPWQWIGFERHPSLITTVPEKPNGPKLTLAQFIEPADAEFAVHCVMCHADLLAALKAIMHTLDYARDNCKPRGAVGRFLFEVKGGCGEHGDLFNARSAIARVEAE